VFPNPASDRVAVACDDARWIALYDAQGRLVRRIASAPAQRAVMVDLHDIAPGVYTLIRTGDVVGTRLVVAR
jgi:glucose dehydrogenase